ncbi:MAG: hypothetical protein ACRBG0_15555 [Lewinella sp.]|jgi:hypothetical protein|uniref:hypothetical protein n=1 Tax=Lewinella sp. TaxID=2004506 RepID=UPI003D6BFFFD
MKKKLFKEKQQYQGKDLIAAIILIMLILAYQLINNVFITPQQGWLNSALCLGVIIGLGWWINALFQREQKNVVTDKKIICKIDSWYQDKKKIALEDIKSCAVVQTPVIAQWHGMNIELPSEEMWSINGRNGLAIETKDGEQIFIGSSRAKEMAQAIKQALQV